MACDVCKKILYKNLKTEIVESFSSSVNDCVYIIDKHISELDGYDPLIIDEDKIIKRLEKLKGDSGCDYHRNSIITECICEVSNYFSELKGGK